MIENGTAFTKLGNRRREITMDFLIGIIAG